MFAPKQPDAPPPVTTETMPTGKGTGSRAGKKASPLWLPAAAKRQLDGMVYEMDTTAQALLTEAVNDLFKKYDKPPIA
jgi:hypothetical protein